MIQLSNKIRRMQMKWSGHILRMSDNKTVKQVFRWEPSSRQSRGRPKKHWMDCVEGLHRAGISRHGITTDRQHVSLQATEGDRSQWRELVAASTAETSFVTTPWSDLTIITPIFVRHAYMFVLLYYPHGLLTPHWLQFWAKHITLLPMSAGHICTVSKADSEYNAPMSTYSYCNLTLALWNLTFFSAKAYFIKICWWFFFINLVRIQIGKELLSYASTKLEKAKCCQYIRSRM